MKLEKQYISGGSFEAYDIRNFKYTVMEGEKQGKSFGQTVHTPRINGELGDAEHTFFIGDREFETAKECYEAL